MTKREKVRPMLVAAAAGRVAAVRKLLSEGADPTSQDDRGSAIHSAAVNGRTKILEILSAAGADINVLDHNLVTPLMAASAIGLQKGSQSALKLIELGADVKYVRKVDGAHALDFAVVRAIPEVIEALINSGAPVDGRRGDAITPLMRAAIEGNLGAVKVLVAHGADRSRTCKLPWAKNKTAFEIASEYKKRSVAKFLAS